MKKIYIVGGNGFARECYYNIQLMAKTCPEIEVAGFLGHGGYGHTVDYKHLQHLYLGEESEHKFVSGEYAVIGAAYPEIRKVIYDDLMKRGVQFFTIHVGDPLNESVDIGEANIFIPFFSCSCNVKIGHGNVFNGEVGVGHDVVIGDFNFFGPRANVLGGVSIQHNNTFGSNTIVMPKAKIGCNNKISPLSVVYKGCRNNAYLHGNPAMKIGYSNEDE